MCGHWLFPYFMTVTLSSSSSLLFHPPPVYWIHIPRQLKRTEWTHSYHTHGRIHIFCRFHVVEHYLTGSIVKPLISTGHHINCRYGEGVPQNMNCHVHLLVSDYISGNMETSITWPLLLIINLYHHYMPVKWFSNFTQGRWVAKFTEWKRILHWEVFYYAYFDGIGTSRSELCKVYHRKRIIAFRKSSCCVATISTLPQNSLLINEDIGHAATSPRRRRSGNY